MKNSGKSIIWTAITLGLLGPIARLSVMGWLALFGILSIVLFGILHIILIHLINSSFNQMDVTSQRIAWISIFTYPLIFLFQFDFGDSPGTFYIYELLTGDFNSNFENYAFYIAIVSAILYAAFFFTIKKNYKSIANNG